MITITGPKAATLPAALGGNDAIYSLVLVAVSRGIIVEELGGGQVQMQGIKDMDLVTVDVVQMLVSENCEVYGYPVYFEVADKTAEVPTNFPNRTYFVENEEDPENPTETVRTWETWYNGMPGHSPVEIDGKFYCSSANTWNMGQPIPASLWGGLNIVSLSQFAALQPTPEV